MKHTGYNSDAFMYAKDGSLLRIRPVPPLFITSYDYKYNGQEYQDELGLNVTAMDFRQYDMALGRFNSIDVLSEIFYNITPYAFSLNLPTLFGDPTGLCPECAKNVSNPTKGASYVVDGINYIFNGTDWEGQVEEVVVKVNNKKTETKETSTVDSINSTAKDINDWVDEKIGKPLRIFFQPASDWATDYSKAHTIIGAGDIWRKHVSPAKELYEAGLGATGLSLSTGIRLFPTTYNVNKLINAGNKIDRNGFTLVGRALQKHGSRNGSVFTKATGNASAINVQGQSVLKLILEHPNVVSTRRHHARFGDILEFKIPNGQGARFSGDGKKFIGFIE